MSWLGLEDKVAVVTGAAGGIGAAVALELARNGARVAVLDINGANARETAREAATFGPDAFALEVDVTDEESVRAAAQEVTNRWRGVDVLVNNAGITSSAPLADVSAADWQRVLDVNLTGYLLCSQQFGSVMRARGQGSIIHVSSIVGIIPQANSGAYSPSKAAISMLARTLALEWGPDGIRSNAVAPGLTRTPLVERIYTTPGLLEARTNILPLRRIGMPQDLANVCTWLASDRSSYVSGQEIAVDGGLMQTLMTHVPKPAN